MSIELNLGNFTSISDLEKRLNEEETDQGRQITSLFTVTNTVPEEGVVFCEYLDNFNAFTLPRLSILSVPKNARASESEFLSFFDGLGGGFLVIEHTKVCIAGKIDVLILLRKIDSANPIELRGDGTWGWHAEVDGNDIVVKDAAATAFGGSNDQHDSGQTASGFPTAGNPNFLGCALPFAYTGTVQRYKDALGGSPIPLMPYGVFPNGQINVNGAQVEVTEVQSGRKITIPVIDRGPAKNTADPRPIDLTVAAAKVFNPNATANNFMTRVDFRIINGVKLAGLKLSAGIQDGFPAEVARIASEQHRAYSHIRESQSPLREQIVRYWNETGNNYTANGVGQPWSAVFVSWVVKQAGATADEFVFSAQHSSFVYSAINRNRPNPAFVGRKISEYGPKIGDIIQNNRTTPGYDFAHASANRYYSSHSAIVVGFGEDSNGRFARTIGGNESDTVGWRKVYLTQAGKVRQNGNYFICILENVKR